MDNGDDTENHFFGPILDITLLIAALISSLSTDWIKKSHWQFRACTI